MSEETDRKPAEVFHPSVVLREEMEARGWDVGTLVKCSWLAREGVEKLLAGSQHITPVFAHGLARAFDTDKEFWLNLQRSYDRHRETSEGENNKQ